MAKPSVAIIGRPNVGKSTLFNRLLDTRLAIVEDEPGVTRDRLHAVCYWNGRAFTLIDTGGLQPTVQNKLYQDVEDQAKTAMLEADVLLFVLDGKVGITPGDWEIADLIRKSHKPVVVVVNKVDNAGQEGGATEFFALGLGDPMPVGALSGLNTGDLLDEVVAQLPAEKEERPDYEQVRVAIVGRPNVGKSSLINKILDTDRLVTSSNPGTTRDAVDVVFEFDNYLFVFVDTAGLRRRTRIKERIEYYSTVRAERAINYSDITVLVLDGLDGATDMDQRIAGYAHEAGKGLVVAINKWDLIKFNQEQFQYYHEEIQRRLSFCNYAPLIFLSALSGRNVERLLGVIGQVRESQLHMLPQAELNVLVDDLLTVTPLPLRKGESSQVYGLTQSGTSPPRFRLHVSNPRAVHFSYLRQIENRIRQLFPYCGTPIKVFTEQTRKRRL